MADVLVPDVAMYFLGPSKNSVPDRVIFAVLRRARMRLKKASRGRLRRQNDADTGEAGGAREPEKVSPPGGGRLSLVEGASCQGGAGGETAKRTVRRARPFRSLAEKLVLCALIGRTWYLPE